MNEEIREWLTEQLKEGLHRVLQVGEVITDYFGEELVDVQIPDLNHCLDTLFAETTLQSALSRTTVCVSSDDDNTMVIGEGSGKITVPKEKWENDREKLILTQKIDTIYYNAMLPSVRRIISSDMSRRYDIIVRFPKVTVTNENDKSIEITELYAKIVINFLGKMAEDFTMIRAEYTAAQYLSHYAHSHLPGTGVEWQYPCLGSGPIGSTITHLRNNFDLDMWGLFCYELSKYVTVESLAGVPYRRLEEVGTTEGEAMVNYPRHCVGTWNAIVRRFTKYYIRHYDFPVAYSDGNYVLGCHPTDFLVEISRHFISWINRAAYIRGIIRVRISLARLLDDGTLVKYIIKDKSVMTVRRHYSFNSMTRLQGRELFLFKGEWVKMNFTDLATPSEGNVVILLNTDIVSDIITGALRIINYNYGHEDCNQDTKDTPYKRHIYI